MENKILNLLKKIIKEDEDTFIDITDMDDDSAAETVISKKDIFKKLRDKMSDKDRTPAGFEYGEIVSGEMGENEMEEGNEFSNSRCKAICGGEKSFSVDGKTYPLKGVDSEDKKSCGCKSLKENKVVFTEAELIDFIERIVEAEKVVDKGFKTAMNTTKKENTDAIKQVASKMKDYMKNMGTDYEENPKSFPKGNKIMSREDLGKEVSDDKKKAYKASDAVEEYIDQIARSGGMEVLEYDTIKPNEEWMEMNIEGSSKTGNSQEYANAIPTDVNKNVNRRRKLNVLNKLKKQSYQKSEQPVYDVSGEDTHMEKMLGIEESTENRNSKKINEDMEKMKKLIGYNQKTQ